MSAVRALHPKPSAPPTLMFISENDHLVPVESMRKFAAQVRQAGIPIHAVSVPYAEHGFEIVGMGNAIVRQVSLQFMRKHDRNSPVTRRSKRTNEHP